MCPQNNYSWMSSGCEQTISDGFNEWSGDASVKIENYSPRSALSGHTDLGSVSGK